MAPSLRACDGFGGEKTNSMSTPSCWKNPRCTAAMATKYEGEIASATVSRIVSSLLRPAPAVTRHPSPSAHDLLVARELRALAILGVRTRATHGGMIRAHRRVDHDIASDRPRLRGALGSDAPRDRPTAGEGRRARHRSRPALRHVVQRRLEAREGPRARRVVRRTRGRTSRYERLWRDR